MQIPTPRGTLIARVFDEFESMHVDVVVVDAGTQCPALIDPSAWECWLQLKQQAGQCVALIFTGRMAMYSTTVILIDGCAVC